MTNSPAVVVVYYIYINPLSNWRAIVRGQLGDLKRVGILDEAELYVHITDISATQGIVELVRQATRHRAVISQSLENQYEYPGIKLLYDLSSRHPDKVFMYFHTKGMSHNTQKRLIEEKALLLGTFKNWRRHLKIFGNHPSVNKIGLFPGATSDDWKGWIWYNFFMARGTYLCTCENPVATDDRYYYEGWTRTGKTLIGVDDCYSLATNSTHYFKQEEVVACVQKFYDVDRKRPFNLLLRAFRRCARFVQRSIKI